MVTPQLMLAQRGNLVSTNFSVGLIGQKFANNSSLDFIGYNGSAGIDLSRLATRYLPRMTSLQAYGTMVYTPATSAFGAMGAGGGFGAGGAIGGGGLIGIAGPTDAGQVTQRIRTTMYQAGLASSYALSPGANFLVNYTYSQLSFGGTYIQPTPEQSNSGTFDTVGHTLSMGPSTRITNKDFIAFNYIFSQYNQQQFGSFSSHAGQLSWSRNWSAEIASSASAGMTLLESFTDTQSFTGLQRRVPATIFPSGSASITYKSGSSFLRQLGSELRESLPGYGPTSGTQGTGFLPMAQGMVAPGGVASSGSYSISLSYALSIFPSYVSQAGPIYSHVVALSANTGLTDRLTVGSFLNFAHSSTTSQTVGDSQSFDTYGLSVMANYLLAPSLSLTFSYNWLRFVDGSASGIPGGGDFTFSKHMVMLGLTYAFDPRGTFFRSGAFWQSASSGGTDSGAERKTLPGGMDKSK
jgi:hypothetical protein